MKKKNILWLVVFSVVFVIGCSSYLKTQTEPKEQEKTSAQTIVIGSLGSDAQIWKHIAASEQAKQLGLNIEVKEINDGVALNRATLNQEIDVNAFQSWGYLKAFNEIHHQGLVAIATTYLEPMGLYSKKYQTLNQLPTGAVVAIPNDAANTARALRLLAQAQLITLPKDFNAISGTPADILTNPKSLSFRTVQSSTTPRVLEEVDLAAIGNTEALDSGLNVLKQSLYYEKTSADNSKNINVLVTSKNDQKRKALDKLGQLYHQPFVNDYIAKNFGGTKVDVNQSITTLN